MTFYDIPAPAKVNLFLHIVGRRADGYHLLQTVFRFIDLCDTLHIESRADGVIARATDLPGVAPADDLTLRAALALQQATGIRQGAHIALEKRIPQGGGLGGGSSDAASVLIALNRLWGTGLTRQQLLALALPLGADVPVFVFGQSAFAEGIGEALTAVSLPQRAYVILQPNASVSTGAVFSAPDLTRNTPLVIMEDFLSLPESTGNFEAFGASGFGRNDLEPVVHRLVPEVFRASQWLSGQGIEVRMSGSGACLFAEYADRSDAILVKNKITATMRSATQARHFQAESPQFRMVEACMGLDEHPLRDWIAG